MNPVRTPQVAAVSAANVAAECLGHLPAPRTASLTPRKQAILSYLALARKYRPRRFGEVATQEHVSETLRRAVAGGRVGHAYLFCGPRGVGKTTLARILAMSLNCPSRTAEGEPCGTCDNCGQIWGGHTSLDVVEIDAASNRGVDDARELRARAMLAPSDENRHKVYILDEAHMLTREAWNALLKILEEPPPRVIFCFATTEPRKIQQSASPILSRCQRFDFRRIGTGDIMKRLGEVLDAEEVPFDPEALRAIARKANGGMRDGLSLLDQVLALSGSEVKIEAVVRVLGVVAEERYLQIFDVIISRSHGVVFDFVEELLDEGHDLVEFFHGLVERLRLLLRLALEPGKPPGVMAGAYLDDYARRAEAFAPGDLVRMLAMASALESDGSLRRTGRPRVMVEMLLLRMSYLDRTVELEEIISALGGAPARKPARAAAPPPVPAPTPQSTETPPPVADTGAGRGGGGGGDRTDPPTANRADARAGVTQSDLASAWKALMEDKARVRAVAPGLWTFLKAARPREADGVLLLEVQPGLEAARWRNQQVLRGLEEALALHAGRDSAKISVVERPGSERGGDGRVTPETVRETRLQELVRQAPQLERAIEELELDLVD